MFKIVSIGIKDRGRSVCSSNGLLVDSSMTLKLVTGAKHIVDWVPGRMLYYSSILTDPTPSSAGDYFVLRGLDVGSDHPIVDYFFVVFDLETPDEVFPRQWGCSGDNGTIGFFKGGNHQYASVGCNGGALIYPADRVNSETCVSFTYLETRYSLFLGRRGSRLEKEKPSA